MAEQRRVKQLDPNVARKIAAGEVIDRPSAIVRELMDNAVDSGASKITVEITSGGIEKIRVLDNGCGMSKEDLENCARPHATSKISTESDLLKLSTLGFRGEALASMAAVSRLEISSGQWKMNASITEDHILTQCPPKSGTIVQTSGLFDSFPARRQFLKRPASEGTLCRTVFEEKAIARPDIEFRFVNDGEEKLVLEKDVSLKQRFIQTMEFFEDEKLFHQTEYSSTGENFSFKLIIGEPEVCRSTRKDIYIYINGRRISEYALIQAIVYGTQGYFPNGTFPVACLFIEMDPSHVDFNIHPAKKEVRFKDISTLHHAISTCTRDFLKNYTVQTLLKNNAEDETKNEPVFEFASPEPFPASTDSKPQIANIHRPVSYSSRSSSFSDTRSKYFSPAKIAEELNSFPKKNYIPEVSQVTGKKSDDGFHFVGLTLGTFIIAEKNETLYIIDQHAAHERILYNKIMSESGKKQELLVPYVIKTDSSADDNYIRTIKDNLEKSGFECCEKEEGVWEFSSVPIRWKGTEDDLKKDILDRRISPGDLINAQAASTACRSAVMDGTVLDTKTAEEIARLALELPDPHCPHGRPVFTTITRQQLFALVRRT